MRELNSCSVETEGFEARLGVQNSWFLQNMSLALDVEIVAPAADWQIDIQVNIRIILTDYHKEQV